MEPQHNRDYWCWSLYAPLSPCRVSPVAQPVWCCALLRAQPGLQTRVVPHRSRGCRMSFAADCSGGRPAGSSLLAWVIRPPVCPCHYRGVQQRVLMWTFFLFGSGKDGIGLFLIRKSYSSSSDRNGGISPLRKACCMWVGCPSDATPAVASTSSWNYTILSS